MDAVAWLVLSATCGVGGLVLCVEGWRQPRPPLVRVIAHLRRSGPIGTAADHNPTVLMRPVRTGGRHLASVAPGLFPTAVELRLVQRSLDSHLGALAVSAVVGALGPALVLGVLQARGRRVAGSVRTCRAGNRRPRRRATCRRQHTRRARPRRADRSAFPALGVPGCRHDAARRQQWARGALHRPRCAGDGRLFVDSGAGCVRTGRPAGAGRGVAHDRRRARSGRASTGRRHNRVVGGRGRAGGANAGREGATLRSTLAAEQEAEARLRTSRLTAPIVGMALVFMALVIYPALSFS